MDKYKKLLKECSDISYYEYNLVKEKFRLLTKELSSKQKLLDKTFSKHKNSNIKNKDVYEKIKEINKNTTDLLKYGFNAFENSLSVKEKNLSDFTITLFGRTKTGKSTIREALTEGDGSTIGKGAQRTTRDVIPYRWNNLRILDTPGFDAYQGEKDEEIAFSQIDETDLILYLVTDDSIQESEFKKLAKLRKDNKPVIIIFNVLHEIEESIPKKELLRNPKEIVSLSAIKGHRSRIEFLSKKFLGIEHIKIIPIHALAAFESTKIKDEKEKKQLYDASNFKHFNDFILKEVNKSGKQKRIQNFRESYISYLENDIRKVYDKSYQELYAINRIMWDIHKKLRRWFDNFIPSKYKEIERKVQNLFNPLYNEVDYFIDEYIEKANCNAQWNYIVNNHVNEEKLAVIQHNIIVEMNEYLNRIYKEFELDMEFIDHDIRTRRIYKVHKGQRDRLLRWSLPIAGLLISPVGMGIGAVLGQVLSSGESDSTRFNRAKLNTKKQMLINLERIQRLYTSKLKNWFYNEITQNLRKRIYQDLYAEINSFRKLRNDYKAILDNIDSLIEKENIELIKRLTSIDKPENYKTDNIINVARVQSVLTKIVVKDSIFENNNSKWNFIKIYGERIVEVTKADDQNQFLLNALQIEEDKVYKIKYNEKYNLYEITVQKKYAGRAIGSRSSNRITTEKLIKSRIKIIGK